MCWKQPPTNLDVSIIWPKSHNNQYFGSYYEGKRRYYEVSVANRSFPTNLRSSRRESKEVDATDISYDLMTRYCPRSFTNRPSNIGSVPNLSARW
jgi:hypothetical protein